MRQRNIAVLNHLGIAGMIASRQNLRRALRRETTLSRRLASLGDPVVASGLILNGVSDPQPF